MDNEKNNSPISLSGHLIELKNHLRGHTGWIHILTDGGLISIEGRPGYCDRGRYIVKVFPSDIEILYIDDSDMFPRYYFKLENLLSEIDLWILERNLTILAIDKKDMNDEPSV